MARICNDIRGRRAPFYVPDSVKHHTTYGFSFKEAGPQLLMQAFLQRIVNGGGRTNREYGLGRKRTDLFIEWAIDEAQGFFGPVQRVVLELKLWKKGSLEAILKEGLPQTVDYARQCGADEAHLIVFDRRPDSPWDDRIWQQTATEQGWTLGVWGGVKGPGGGLTGFEIRSASLLRSGQD